MSETRVVGIVDYGMGNMQSVLNAFAALGHTTHLLANPMALNGITHVVLPGVGGFGDGMAKLQASGWDDALHSAVVRDGLPFLGICLGMQMLMAHGTEHGPQEGLGWIPGTVVRLPDAPGLRIPHIGWNNVRPHRHCRLFEGIGEAPDFYFVHSYAVVPSQDERVAATCDYTSQFVAAVHAGQVHGVQFHPEKSHGVGLRLLDNFVRSDRAPSC